MNTLIIVGASGHGKVIADIAIENGYTDIVFFDDDESIKECAGFPVVGHSDDFGAYPGADVIIAIGNASIRRRITEYIVVEEFGDANSEDVSVEESTSSGVHLVSLIHPSAVIGRNVEIGTGSVVMAGAVINHGAKLGIGCIVNTGSSVDHDCVIGDYNHISVGAHVAGTVVTGDNVWVGAGAIVSNNLSICDDCMIGAGAVVVKDITEAGKYIGVPAKCM